MGNKSSKSSKQKLYKIPANAEPPFPPTRPTVDSDEDSAYIEWAPSHYDGGCPIISYIIQFKTLDEPSWTNTEPLTETCCWLRNLRLGYVYNFRIIAENLIGYSHPSEPSSELLVSLDNVGPSVLFELTDLCVMEMERVEFNVKAAGKPRPEFTWYSNGLEVIPGSNVVLSGSKLVFKQASRKLNGTVKCVVENEAGFAETVCSLTVGVPPRIVQSSDEATKHYLCRVGEVLRLKLKVEGCPEPRIHWTHNGSAVQGQNETLTMGCWAVLKIDNVTRSDRGEYELFIENTYGHDVGNVLVTVADRPSPLRSAPVVRLQKDDSCLIEWGVDLDGVDDGGCPIKTWIVEYYRVGWDVWLTGATTRNKSTRIRELIPGSKYIFRVKNENPYGVSDPSPESATLFIPELSSGLMSTLDEEIIPGGGRIDEEDEDGEVEVEEIQDRNIRKPIEMDNFTHRLSPKPLKIETRSGSTSKSNLQGQRSPTKPTLSNNLLDHYYNSRPSPSLHTEHLPKESLKTATRTPSPSSASASQPKYNNSHNNYIYESGSDDDEQFGTESESEEPELSAVEVKCSLTLTKTGSCAIKTSKEELSSVKTSRSSLSLSPSGRSSGDIAEISLNVPLGEDSKSKPVWNPFRGKFSASMDSKNYPGENTDKAKTKTTSADAEAEKVPDQVPELLFQDQDQDNLAMCYIGLVLLIGSLFVKYLNLFVSLSSIGFLMYRLFKL